MRKRESPGRGSPGRESPGRESHWEPWLALAVCVLLLFAIADAVKAEPAEITPAVPLQQAVDAAEAGATLVLAPGVYSGNLRIDQPLTLIGRPGAILDAQGKGDVVRISAPDVTLRGLEIRNSGFNLTDMNAGVFIDRGAHRAVIDDNILDNVAFGLWIWHADEPMVRGNRIRGNPTVRSQDRGDGIRIYNVRHGVYADNDIVETRDGIYIETSSHNDIIGNRMRDLRYGVHYMFTHHGRVIGNTSENTRSGFALMMSQNLEVIGNRSINDRNYGLLLNYINYSTIVGNRVAGVIGWAGGGGEHGVVLGGEGKALFVYHSLHNDIRDNLFAHSEIGIHLTAGAEHNRVHGNAFVANTVQVKYVSNREQDWSGNYWSNYLGWDLDGDGFGDQPFEPNDSVDRLLWRYPDAKLLFNSPAVVTLRWVQRRFPVLRTPGVRDSTPLMRPPG